MPKSALSILCLTACLVFSGAAVAQQKAFTAYETEAPFAGVAADVSDAIINRGYVVDYHGLIGEMLERTAADVGAEKALYRDAEFFQFCSAVLSRKMMEEDLTNIAFCPYVIFVYEAEGKPGAVTVGFRRLPDGDGRDEINSLLDQIAREAAGQ
jgi:hypothetical protein